MLNAMAPGEFNERLAYELIEPAGRRNSAAIQAQIILEAQQVMSVITKQKAELKEINLDDLMPAFGKQHKAPKRKQSLRAGFAQVQRMMGF